MSEIDKIIFVYNADKDVLSASLGYLHKVFSPSTYPCELCSLTHSNVGERRAWSKLKAETNFEMEFIYKSEFESRFSLNVELPVILSLNDDSPKVLMTKTDFTGIKSPDELMHLLNYHLHRKMMLFE